MTSPIKSVNAVFFSATDTTKKIVQTISSSLAAEFGTAPVKYYDATPLAERLSPPPCFAQDELVVVGVPVYAGRVPNVLLKYFQSLQSAGSPTIAVVLFGNRDYDDALIELVDILREDGFDVIAAAAFVGEHSFSYELAKGRPDADDLALAANFAQKAAAKLQAEKVEKLTVKGEQPYRAYYKPRDEQGNPVDIRKITPVTGDSCTDCKLCAELCPMDSIDKENVRQMNGICIKCGACIKKCPSQAKTFVATDFVRHKVELEQQLKERKSPELFY